MRLLVVLDRPDTALFTLRTAEALARTLPVDDIRILHPQLADNPAFQAPDEGIPAAAEQKRFAHEVSERADRLRDIASAWIEQSLPDPQRSIRKQWIEIAGDIRKIVCREACCAAFVVHGRPRAEDPDYVGRAFAGALYDAEAAVVIAPLHDYPSIGRKPVIAWHASQALDQAVSAAMPLLQAAERITFVIGEHGSARTELPDFAHSLAAAGADIVIDRFTAGTGEIGEQIRAHALAADADLLIMGAYTRPHFLEWLFGGSTEDVFAHAALPILTHH